VSAARTASSSVAIPEIGAKELSVLMSLFFMEGWTCGKYWMGRSAIGQILK
jgi:hypothetical protein